MKNITLPKEDAGTLCICALRYAMGRRTYAPLEITEICERILGKLDDSDIAIMLQDCEVQKKKQNWGNSTIDKPVWVSWYHLLLGERDRRCEGKNLK